MKKIIYFSALAFTFICNLSLAQDRNVVWVHGMEGSAQSWQQNYQHYTGAKKITNVVVAYNSANGAIDAANQVRTQINSQLGTGNTNPTNMAIGHSMGGLTIRQMEKDDKQNNVNRIGGFITVGTPHNGAQIANAEQQGLIKPFLQNGVNDLLAGPTAVVLGVPVIANFVSTKLSDWIGAMLYSEFKSFGQGGAIDDLKVGNPTLATLNAYNCTKPRIALAGNEDAPALWKQIGSIALNSPSNIPRNQVKDNAVADMASKATGIYDGFYWTYRVLSWVPKVKFVNNYYVNCANAWLRGKVWIERANGIWFGMAGAVQSSTMVSYPFLSNSCALGICIGKVQSQSFQINTPAPFDGIVRANSATALPGALYTKVVQGVNHQECVNHPGINGELDAILNNTVTGTSPFFFTQNR